MVIIGAKGHAKEMLQILQDQSVNPLVFFDNISTNETSELLYNKFKIITNFQELKNYFETVSTAFCTGIGTTTIKKNLVNKVEALGGVFTTVIATNAHVGEFEVFIGQGSNVMQRAFISNSVSIGKGNLINFDAALHHDVIVGDFCEISPRATVLGRCKIGDYVSIGASSTILPDVIIGDYAVIGAGAVVIKNVKANTTVVGVPGKQIKNKYD